MDLITTPTQVGYTPPETSIVHQATASMTDRAPSAPVHIVQYDMTMPIVAVSLTANGSPYTVPAGAAVNFRMGKPDGTYIYNPAIGVSSNGQVVYVGITQQTAAAYGPCQPVVEIVLNGAVAASGSFSLIIDKNPVPDDAIASGDEYLSMQEILAQVQQAAEVVQAQATNLQNLTDNLEAVQNAAANATAAAQSAAQAAQSAQQALGFRTFFDAVSPDANGSLDPSRPMTTAAAQASWTVKSKGDRIQSVQVNGFTQDGANAGISLVHLSVTSDIVWVKAGTRGAYQYMPKNIAKKTNNADKALIYCSALPVNSANSTYAGSAGISVNNSGVLQINFGEMSPQDYISINGPFDIWYVPEDSAQATGLYIPIQAQGHEYRCQCLPVTEALGSGDNAQSNVPSGCDLKLVYDGSSDENWALNQLSGGTRFVINVKDVPTTDAENGRGFSNLLFLAPSGGTGEPTNYYCFTVASNGNLYVKTDGVQSLDDFKGWLKANNLVFYFRSNNYVASEDIPVQLESHANGNVYAHDPVTLVAVPYTKADVDAANQLANTPSTLDTETQAAALPVVGTYVVSSQEGATVAVSLKPFQDGGDAATVGGYTAQELIAGSGDVDAATLNGQTAQQILQSAESTAQGYTQSYTQSYVQQQMQNVYTKAQTQQIVPFLYKATFDVDGWTGSGSGHTQTVAVTPVNGGPAITAQSVMTSAVTVDDTVQGSAGDELDAAAAIVNGGTKTFGSGTITCVIQGAAPTADAEVFFTASGGGN